MNPPANVQSLIWDDLKKEMATHPSILAWESPWTEEPGGLHTVHGGLSDLVTKQQQQSPEGLEREITSN